MMNKLACSLLLLSLSISSAHATQVVVVDMNRLFSEYHKTREAEIQVQQALQSANEEHQENIEEYQDQEQAFHALRERSALSELTEEQRTTLAAQASEMLNQLQSMQENIREQRANREQEIEAQGRRLRRRIVDEIRETVGEMATESGWEVVLDSAGASASGIPVVLHADTPLDVSDRVLQRLNQPQTQPTAAESP